MLSTGTVHIDRGASNAGLVAVDNLVDAIVLVSHHLMRLAGQFNVTDDLPVTFKTWADDLARVFGLKPPSLSIPYSVAMPVAFVSEVWNFIRHGSQQQALLPVHVARLLGQSQDFSTAKLRALGWAPRVTYESVLESIRHAAT